MDRKTLIILPGWGGNKDTWKEFANLAGKDFDVQIIDLPCFGDEPCPKTAWGAEEYAEFVRSKIVELRTTNSEMVLLGHSFGGQIATVFASLYPGMIDKLILSAPAVFRPKRLVKRFFFGMIAKIGKILFKLPTIGKFNSAARNIYYNLIKAKDYHEATGIKTEIFKKIIRQDLTEILSKIKIPVLIIWGDKDGYLPVKDAYKLNKLIFNSKLEIIKGGKHGLHLQMPEKLCKIVYDLIH